jgi:hypothetical protein
VANLLGIKEWSHPYVNRFLKLEIQKYLILRLILNHYRFPASRGISSHAALLGLILNSFPSDLLRMWLIN